MVPSGAYDEVYVYSMSRPGFILQHVVDAFGVQTANAESKPIRVVFGLIGLYLHVEKQFSGHEAQRMPPGSERDMAIDDWCRCVWIACASLREAVIALLREYKIV